MTQLRFTREALADIDRFTDFLAETDPEAAADTLEIIVNAVEVLRRHPYIGRPIEHGLRELVISRGRTGYIALYKFLPSRREVLIARLRHQLEAGYEAE